jgi:hypothetical protein
MSQGSAGAYCKNLILGDQQAGSWSLPSVKELITLVDYATYDPSINNSAAFPGALSEVYWTASSAGMIEDSPLCFLSQPYQMVNFSTGTTCYGHTFSEPPSAVVRCVRPNLPITTTLAPSTIVATTTLAPPPTATTTFSPMTSIPQPTTTQVPAESSFQFSLPVGIAAIVGGVVVGGLAAGLGVYKWMKWKATRYYNDGEIAEQLIQSSAHSE